MFDQLRLMKKLLQASDVSLQRGGQYLLKGISWEMKEGEHWAFTGGTGSGKTIFTQCLAGEIPYGGTIDKSGSPLVIRIAQQHHFRNRSNTQDHYYQQRFHSQDADDAPTVREVLSISSGGDAAAGNQWLDKMGMADAADKSLLQLSNGEHKRLQLIKALISKPDILIFDQPFTGLDKNGRKLLEGLLIELAVEHIQLVIITGGENIPEVVTHVAVFREGRIIFTGKKEDFNAAEHLTKERIVRLPNISNAPTIQATQAFSVVAELRNATVEYGSKIILQDINWVVAPSSRWLLAGPNGAGKSTLLSLLYADNPQAYANEIYLFDRRRGSGETIWDIKRNIGFVSPELHWYFGGQPSVFEVVASGFFDTIGLFRTLSTEQEAIVMEWIKAMALENYRSRTLQQLSLGQQRLALLARAMIKVPPLLILDEPCQGLDESNTAGFNELVDNLCAHMNTTLIYVTHYTQAIPSCITHVLELENGKIKKLGPLITRSIDESVE